MFSQKLDQRLYSQLACKRFMFSVHYLKDRGIALPLRSIVSHVIFP